MTMNVVRNIAVETDTTDTTIGTQEEWVDVDYVRETLNAHLKTTTGKAVADAVGMSAAAISQFRSGKYQGDVKALALRLSAYLTTAHVRSGLRTMGFVETSVAQGIWNAVRYAEVMGRIVCVMGAPGMGKTTTLREFCRRNPAAVYLSAHQGITGAKAFTEELSEALKVHDAGRTLRQQLKSIVATLNNSGRLIVIDEAQKLNALVLETIRDIHDQTGVGMVLSGNLEIHPLMQRRGAGQFAQLLSRIAVQHRVPDEVSAADVQLLAEAAEAAVDKSAVQLLTTLSNTQAAGLRRAANILATLQGVNGPVTAESVHHAMRMVGR